MLPPAPQPPLLSRILLVEDEPLTREGLAEMLGDAGYEVTATCTGDEAAILVAHTAFDLLLTDVVMPGAIDGIGLAQHAREVHPGLPVVFVSGRAAVHGVIGPPVRFVPKPCNANALIGAIRSLAET